jgi:hypothetical protein
LNVSAWRQIVAALLIACVSLALVSCAGTTSVVGLTTTQDADAADKHPR